LIQLSQERLSASEKKSGVFYSNFVAEIIYEVGEHEKGYTIKMLFNYTGNNSFFFTRKQKQLALKTLKEV